MKKQISLLSLIGLSIALSIPNHAIKAVSQAISYTPANTQIVFDVDGVILKKKNGRVAKALWNHRTAVAKFFVQDPKFAYKTIKNLCNGSMPGEQLYYHFKDRHPELSEMVSEITTDKDPISGTPEIIKDLKKAGYTLHIATNMGISNYSFYKARLPEIFNIFDKAKAIDFSQRRIIAKPNPAYFQDFLDTYADKSKQNKLFIDDKWDNVQAASKKGFIAIQFKTPAQLRKDLKKLGIL